MFRRIKPKKTAAVGHEQANINPPFLIVQTYLGALQCNRVFAANLGSTMVILGLGTKPNITSCLRLKATESIQKTCQLHLLLSHVQFPLTQL